MKNNKDLSNKILLEVLRKEYFELAAQEDISPTPEKTIRIDELEQLITDLILDNK